MEAVLADFRPDVVHLHNIYHQLSPSVLQPMRRRGIAARDDAARLQARLPDVPVPRPRRSPARRASPHRFWEPVAAGAATTARSARAPLNAVELTLHTLGRAYAPGRRLRLPQPVPGGKMRQGRVFPDRLRVDPATSSTWTRSPPAQGPGGGVVFAGRLSDGEGRRRPDRGGGARPPACGSTSPATARCARDARGAGHERGASEPVRSTAGCRRAELHELLRSGERRGRSVALVREPAARRAGGVRVRPCRWSARRSAACPS